MKDPLNDLSATSCLETVPEASNHWGGYQPTSRYARRRLSMAATKVAITHSDSIRSNPFSSCGSNKEKGIPVNKSLGTLMSKLDAVMTEATPEKKGRRQSMF
jgi:hypothetical protein